MCNCFLHNGPHKSLQRLFFSVINTLILVYFDFFQRPFFWQ